MTDKEFYATFSLGTSWLAIDKDGYVAIVDINNDGPSPKGWEDDVYPNEVVWQWLADEVNGILALPLTDEQLAECLIRKEDESGEWDEIVLQIDKAKEPRFLELIQDSNSKLEESDCYDFACISREHGLYYIDWWNGKREDVIKAMKSKGIVVGGQYELEIPWYYDYDSNDEEWRELSDMPQLPVFRYLQGGDPTHDMAARVYTPRHPLHVSQIPEREVRQNIHLPFRFTDTPVFQLAKYCSFYVHRCKCVEMDGKEYRLMPTEEGGSIYINPDIPSDCWTEEDMDGMIAMGKAKVGKC